MSCRFKNASQQPKGSPLYYHLLFSMHVVSGGKENLSETLRCLITGKYEDT